MDDLRRSLLDPAEMSAGRETPQSDDQLGTALRQRLVDEGFPPDRAEALATALLDPVARPDALRELNNRLDRLTDVLERLTDDVEQLWSNGARACRGGNRRRRATAETEARLSTRSAAVERALERLREVGEEGESGATPAIMIGRVWLPSSAWSRS